MAHRLGRPLITVACHDDLSASDLTGRFLIQGNDTVWADGPLTTAVRTGAICYLDEVVESRQDTLVVIHPVTDDRRILPIEKTGELLTAAPGFQLVVSYNPGLLTREIKPATRQRFAAIDFAYPDPEREAAIVARESGLELDRSCRIVAFGVRTRRLAGNGLEEGASTRMLVAAARLVAGGMPVTDACRIAIVGALADEADVQLALQATLDASF